jgi:hypothetical protein
VITKIEELPDFLFESAMHAVSNQPRSNEYFLRPKKGFESAFQALTMRAVRHPIVVRDHQHRTSHDGLIDVLRLWIGAV